MVVTAPIYTCVPALVLFEISFVHDPAHILCLYKYYNALLSTVNAARSGHGHIGGHPNLYLGKYHRFTLLQRHDCIVGFCKPSYSIQQRLFLPS
jgi:hypothetical protein